MGVPPSGLTDAVFVGGRQPPRQRCVGGSPPGVVSVETNVTRSITKYPVFVKKQKKQKTKNKTTDRCIRMEISVQRMKEMQIFLLRKIWYFLKWLFGPKMARVLPFPGVHQPDPVGTPGSGRPCGGCRVFAGNGVRRPLWGDVRTSARHRRSRGRGARAGRDRDPDSVTGLRLEVQALGTPM